MIIFLLLIIFLFLPVKVFAVCPVCTVAIGAGVGLSRYLGIDDTVSGIWIGGFIVSSSLWTSSWLKAKNINFRSQNFLLIIFFFTFTLIPLYYTNTVGHYLNTFYGIDKLIFGIIVGSSLFFISVLLDRLLRLKNHGKVLFFYQKVILPLVLLFIASLVFYFITLITKV